jgi:signal transduction histidine kinase
VIAAPPLQDEAHRLELLNKLDILDTQEEQPYDDITSLAAQICNTPVSLITLLDETRYWFKSHHGLEARQVPREYGFCNYTLRSEEVFHVENSTQDPRFQNNPLVTGAPHVKFYAAIPIKLNKEINGDIIEIKVGTLCVVDYQANTLSPIQRQALKTLGKQVETLLNLRLKVKELTMLKNELIGIINQELYGPIASMHTALSLLSCNNVEKNSQQGKKLISNILLNSECLMNIANNILDLMTLKTGCMVLKKRAHNINATIKKCVKFAEECLQARRLKLHLTLDPNITELQEYDEARIIQVLQNLLSNAVKHSPTNSEIIIHTQASPTQVLVAIKDHGCGIPANQQHKLFEEFVQVNHDNYSKVSGTGLGLNIIKHIVELHGGKIYCESKAGLGSTFTFTLPM